jgi:single-strand DNA-binding protein
MVLNQEIEEEFNMNKTVLIGRLTKDPELKFTPGNGTAVATFTLAVDRRALDKNKEKQADYIPIVVWGKQAESTANYTVKGSLVSVAGRIQIRSYDAKDGTKRYVTEVVAEEVQFLDKKGTVAPSNQSNDEMTPVDDGVIPF